MRKLLLFLAAFCSAGYAGAQCASSFTAALSPQGNNLLNVNFNNTSSYGLPYTGQQKSFVIDYGDGTFANGTVNIPNHVYAAPGTYTIGLRIFNVDSVSQMQVCTDSFGIVLPVGYSSCGTTMAVTGTGATRSFSATTPLGATGMTYSWNFGDGGTATGATVSHTYATAGSYTVTLSATSSTAPTCTYVNVRSIYISLPPAPLNCSSLAATFSTSTSANVVTLVNTSSSVPQPPYLVQSQWDFGDGATSTSRNPVPHTYTSTGVYTITLRTIWRDSTSTTVCSDTERHVVAIASIPAPPNLISGQVRYDSLTYGINNFKVWLIKLDSAANTLYAVDSQITANTANAYYSFANKPSGVYRTKAAVYLGSGSGAGLIPTYHDSSAYWNTAMQIYHYGGSSINRHIYMRTGMVSAGPGFIGGNISLGANKGTAGGARGIMVFLRDNAARIVALTYTDSLGNYSFSNLATGAYSVYPEMLNIATTPITPIVLSGPSPRYASGDFSYDETRRSIVPRAALDVPVCYAAPGLYISPVPAHDKLNIAWVSATEGELRFIITSSTGQSVARTESLRGVSGNVTLDVSNLAPGIYFVHGTGAVRGSISRIVIQ